MVGTASPMLREGPAVMGTVGPLLREGPAVMGTVGPQQLEGPTVRHSFNTFRNEHVTHSLEYFQEYVRHCF